MFNLSMMHVCIEPLLNAASDCNDTALGLPNNNVCIGLDSQCMTKYNYIIRYNVL